MPQAAPAVSRAESRSPERHLRTDHLVGDLGHRAVSGGLVTTGAEGVKFAVNLTSAIVLARLLTPRDFGLVAMAGALMPILRTFREGGLSTATIQREDVTHAQVSNLFWINLALGAVITSIGCGLAPVVAWFYHDSRLLPLTILLSLSFLLSGSAVQHLALINRQMRFATSAMIDVTAATFGLVVGITAAKLGAGYWSLVAMQLSTTCAETTMTWYASGWWPQLPMRKAGTRPLVTFGASMTVYILLRRLASCCDVILAGRFFGPSPVGLYSRGQALLQRPLDQFISPFDAVFVPVLSRLQNQPSRYRETYLKAYGSVATLSFVLAGMLIGLSRPIVLVLLGGKWAGVVPIFAWLSIAALHIPLTYASMWLLTTQGRSRDLTIIGMITPFITLLSVVAGLPFGIVGVAASLSLVGCCVRLPVQYAIIGRAGPVRTRDLWAVALRHLPVGIAVALCAGAVRHELDTHRPWLQLLGGGGAGVAAAAILIAAIPALRQQAAFMIGRLALVMRGRPAPAAQ